MLLLTLFSFLAGLFTILSPCILPILPAILSVSVLRGKWRPLGIILGLILSFSFFTLFLTSLVHAFGISPNILRYFAIAILFLFGLILLIPQLSNWFASFSSTIAQYGEDIQGGKTRGGFFSGLLFGAALGLIWTPCAGPILAAITTLAATQSVNFNTIILTLAYSFGAGIPLLLIAYGGQSIIHSSKFLSRHSEGIRQFFGCLMIVTAAAIAFHWDAKIQESISHYVPPILIENNPYVKETINQLEPHGKILKNIKEGEFSNYGPAPEFVGITSWINTPPLSLQSLKGKVVLVDFWTYSCINCLRTLPYIKKWYADYSNDGFVVVGMHTPEFEFEKDLSNVMEAVKRLGITYPVALDNDYKTWQAYGNHYWPADYLIDQNGDLRLVHFGEGDYEETENLIRLLLGKKQLDFPKKKHEQRALSPETYLGTNRAEHYSPHLEISPDKIKKYDYSLPLKENQVGLKGIWKVEGEKITAEGADSYLQMNVLAEEVYLVLSGTSQTPLEVSVDNQKFKTFEMDGDRKYDIAVVPYGRHLISIHIPQGVSAYAFTFGDTPNP